MAHLLYSVGVDGSYRLEGEMKRENTEKGFPAFAWRTGVIFRALESKRTDWVNQPPYRWHLTEDELLLKIPKVEDAPNEYAIVYDIMPSSRRTILLLRLKELWGFTYDIWTPLLLKLEILYEDKNFKGEPVDAKGEFKASEPNGRKTIFEFLYLNGGYDGTKFTYTWRWGAVGAVNGALLWPDALDYFLPSIRANK